MKAWLQDYHYRISLGWPIFILAAAISVAIAQLTVNFRPSGRPDRPRPLLSGTNERLNNSWRTVELPMEVPLIPDDRFRRSRHAEKSSLDRPPAVPENPFIPV
jgi:hypothetical protein